ncbi:SoxR reducing system RseC family protein [Agaribacter marinus]|uniref:Uncharacterized protein n=1 Tax=Agaribacter marinus TaxID=1431249 RepID=A0AA37T6A5_9ALTE|nr:SoxR reducing system RseC family protein [Agaribacter marinus]GLR73043.1 hypothetical protein GCM10007852_39510 [Agaribacter marinus]
MIEEVARVIDTNEHSAVVETQIKTACGSCKANKDCGTSVVAKAFANKTHQFTISTVTPLVVGQFVKIGVPESSILKASLYLYLFPILVLILSAATFEYMFSDIPEYVVVLMSFGSTALSFVYISHKLKGVANYDEFTPVFLGVSNEAQALSAFEIPIKKID